MKRLSFIKWYMEMAHLVSLRSPDNKLKVGAVLVSKDNRKVFGIGYNGNVSGFPNKRKSKAKGHSAFLHAELNAISLNASFESRYTECQLFVTHEPCEMCAKLISQQGKIKTVYYSTPYDGEGLKILRKAKIKIKKVV